MATFYLLHPCSSLVTRGERRTCRSSPPHPIHNVPHVAAKRVSQ